MTTQVCVPNCAAKECGDDGCGGLCGPGCGFGDTCGADGICGKTTTCTKYAHYYQKRGWKTADKKPVKNQDLWQALDTAVARHEITWHWVKGHAGHPGNERADTLANEGIAKIGLA